MVAALCVFIGGCGEEKIDIDALQKAAQEGDPEAQNNLGNMYISGQGITQSDTKAFEWYQKAAVQGHASAQFNLSIMYEYGLGVSKSEEKATDWLQKAAQGGDTGAQLYLSIVSTSVSTRMGFLPNYVKYLREYKKYPVVERAKSTLSFFENNWLIICICLLLFWLWLRPSRRNRIG